jgi:hypothetical protein
VAALNGSAPSPEDAFERVVRSAQDRLRHAEELAQLSNDPALEGYRALAAHLEVLAGHHRLEKERINARLAVIDERLDEIHDVHAELKEMGTAAVAGAKAEIARTQSDLARQAAQQIAATAANQLRTMARTAWLRAVSAAVAVGLVAFVTGGGLGFAWGSGAAARTIRTADAVVHFVAAQEGTAAVSDWNTLMRYNPILTLMARCTGRNLAREDNRKACHMWLWIEQPPLSRMKTKG